MLSDVAMACWECLLSLCKIEMGVPPGEGPLPKEDFYGFAVGITVPCKGALEQRSEEHT